MKLKYAKNKVYQNGIQNFNMTLYQTEPSQNTK